MVKQLVDLRADVNERYRASASNVIGWIYRIQSLQFRLGAKRPAAMVGHHMWGATPIMVAVLTGKYEGVMALLHAKARVDVRNARGKTVMDFAHKMEVPSYVLQALEGQTGVCERMVSAASQNRYPIERCL